MTTPTDRVTELSSAGLFEDLAQPSAERVQQAQVKKAIKRGQGEPRLLQPNRSQIELRASDLESLLAQAHRARLVWGYVMHQDLSKLIEAIKHVAARPVVRQSTRVSCSHCGYTPHCKAWAADANWQN
ncbi:hypothetical protein Y695_02153 [Hydrogenophaga sp. T4]|nr:hypothetical protein Y695_02153 [Hydrogenophaga sp. T4]